MLFEVLDSFLHAFLVGWAHTLAFLNPPPFGLQTASFEACHRLPVERGSASQSTTFQ